MFRLLSAVFVLGIVFLVTPDFAHADPRTVVLQTTLSFDPW